MQFKIGDKVRHKEMTAHPEYGRHGFPVGAVGSVVNIDVEFDVATVVVQPEGRSNRVYLNAEYVELVETTAEQGPGEEDGPWAKGWDQRSSSNAKSAVPLWHKLLLGAGIVVAILMLHGCAHSATQPTLTRCLYMGNPNDREICAMQVLCERNAVAAGHDANDCYIIRYLPADKQQQQARAACAAGKLEILGDSQYALTLSLRLQDNSDARIIQLVKSRIGDADEVVATFDFKHTQSYYSPSDDYLECDREFIRDKVLLYVESKLVHPVNTFQRMLKFARRGYKVPGETLVKLMKAVHDIDPASLTVCEKDYDGSNIEHAVEDEVA